MLHFRRSASVIGAPLFIAALLACVMESFAAHQVKKNVLLFMNRLIVSSSVAFTLGLGMLPSESQAFCTQAGNIVAVFVSPGGSAIDVRAVQPGSPQFRYTTSDDQLVNAALSAEASHQNAQLRGGTSGSVCPTAGTLRSGGNIVSISVGLVP
ncbi:MAG: hypothetical protein L0Y50_12540 [Beijerinckiaceae bacterium]|nr:hypothetical protein [Beijerinckiaceae bacterium]MCI0737076.1 hypothetical protein [Beijerinckiaceae bacterium]